MVRIARIKRVLGTALLLVCLIGVALLGSPQLVARASAKTASITLSPTSGPPTTRVTVQGTGFGPKEQIVITLDNNPVGKGKTNKQGNFTAKFTVPKDYGPGPTPVQATGQSSGLTAQATFTINTDWPSSGFDAQNTRDNIYENVLNPSDAQFLVLNWSYKQGKRAVGTTSVVNGILYLGGGGTLQALNAQTGKLIWKSNLTIYETAVANGIVYGGSRDGNLYAVNAQTGATLWSYSTGGVYLEAPPTVVNGVVYIGNLGIYAVNAQTGALIWKYPTEMVYGEPSVVNGVVYFGSLDKNLYALDAQTGNLIWKYTTGIVYSSPSVVNGVVYFGAGDNVDAFNARTGAPIWSYKTGYIVASSPAVANGIVYIGSFDQNLYALNAQTGAVLWQYNTGKIIDFYSSPLVANGVVYVGASLGKQGSFFAFDAQKGTLLWSYSGAGNWVGYPIVTNGFFYLGINKVLYAFSLPGLKR